MALRVTQQSVDVLSEATGGKLRVTQFYVEALGNPVISLTDTLALTDAAVDDYIIVQTLNLTDSVTVQSTRLLSVSNYLGLSQTLVEQSTFARVLVDTLALTHTVAEFDRLSPYIYDTLALTDTLVTNFKCFSINDNLGLTDSVPPQPYHTSNIMALTDVAISSIKSISVANTLAFSQIVVDLTNLHVFDIITLADTAVSNIHDISVANSVAFADIASATKTHNVSSIIPLTDAVKRALQLPRSIAAPISFVQSVEIYIAQTKSDLCTYAPQVGTGPITISSTPPTITPSTLTLFWPTVSPSLTVVLRNPKFGNKIAYTPNRINRKSRGGKMIVFRDNDWPTFTLLTMEFEMLNATQIAAFKSFLQSTLGLVVGLTDHDGGIWNGIITTPDTPITQLSGSNSCPNHATSFQMEAQKIS